jgi:hypothetical protein
MRELFADEMTAQRELHDRVAKTHIADFQEQFHTQTISTISFAVAQLPLQPPDIPAGGRVTGKRSAVKPTAPQQAIKPSPALDTMSPPTSTMLPPQDLDSLALADGTGTAVRENVPQRRKAPLVIAALAVVAVLAVVAFAMLRGDKQKPAVAKADDKANQITVVPIEEQPKPDVKKVETPISVDAQEPSKIVDKVKTPEPGTGSHKKQRVRDRDKDKDKKKEVAEAPQKDAVSRDAVTNEWLAAKREYAAYKNKNGTTLEKEYTDLVVYVQFNVSKEANLPETLAKIQSFRRKIRE